MKEWIVFFYFHLSSSPPTLFIITISLFIIFIHFFSFSASFRGKKRITRIENHHHDDDHHSHLYSFFRYKKRTRLLLLLSWNDSLMIVRIIMMLMIILLNVMFCRFFLWFLLFLFTMIITIFLLLFCSWCREWWCFSCALLDLNLEEMFFLSGLVTCSVLLLSLLWDSGAEGKKSVSFSGTFVRLLLTSSWCCIFMPHLLSIHPSLLLLVLFSPNVLFLPFPFTLIISSFTFFPSLQQHQQNDWWNDEVWSGRLGFSLFHFLSKFCQPLFLPLLLSSHHEKKHFFHSEFHPPLHVFTFSESFFSDLISFFSWRASHQGRNQLLSTACVSYSFTVWNSLRKWFLNPHRVGSSRQTETRKRCEKISSKYFVMRHIRCYMTFDRRLFSREIPSFFVIFREIPTRMFLGRVILKSFTWGKGHDTDHSESTFQHAIKELIFLFFWCESSL